jgi:hypothetical protein
MALLNTKSVYVVVNVNAVVLDTITIGLHERATCSALAAVVEVLPSDNDGIVTVPLNVALLTVDVPVSVGEATVGELFNTNLT